MVNSRPAAYRFLSCCHHQPPSYHNGDDGKKDMPDPKACLRLGSDGRKINSASAAALYACTDSPTGTSFSLPTSGSSRGLNLMATFLSPGRKSEDWSNSRARSEALKAIQGDLSAYASGDSNLETPIRRDPRRVGTRRANKRETEIAQAKKAEDLFEEDPYWGKRSSARTHRRALPSSIEVVAPISGSPVRLYGRSLTSPHPEIVAASMTPSFPMTAQGWFSAPTNHYGTPARTTRASTSAIMTPRARQGPGNRLPLGGCCWRTTHIRSYHLSHRHGIYLHILPLSITFTSSRAEHI